MDPNTGPVSGHEMVSSQLSRMIFLAIEDTAFIAAVALVAAAAVIVLFVVVFRRTTMSDELSKEYEAKLEALRQAPTSEGMLVKERPSTHPAGIRRNAISPLPPESGTEKMNEQIQRYAQENAQLRAKEAAYQREIEKLRDQLEAVTKELAAGKQKFESSSSSLEKEKAALREHLEDSEKNRRGLQENTEKLERELAAERQESASFRILVQNERVRLRQQMQEMEKHRRELEEAKDSLEKQFLQLRAKKTCPSCARELQFQDRYCDRCGFRFIM